MPSAAWALFLPGLFTLGAVGAADEPAGTYVLDDVMVSARRLDLDEVQVETASGFLSVVELSPKEMRNTSVGEILEKGSGTQVRRSGDLGSYSGVSLRGASPGQVGVFFDGVSLNPAAGGGTDLSNIAVESLGRIEVFRGSAPARFSASPIGGVVNLVPRREPGRSTASLKLAAGSFGTLDAAVNSSLARERWNLMISAGRLTSQGDFTYTDDNFTPDDPSDDSRDTRINNDLEQVHLLLGAGRKLGAGRRLDFLYSLLDKEKGLAGTGYQQAREARLSTAQQVAQLKFSQKPGADRSHALELRLYWQLLE
ncbi:MAG: TonB-dependent receptor, partial [Planctomycetes bacterium]|nr:TonB-dependent receptor [Planctomycetota bacterium]